MIPRHPSAAARRRSARNGSVLVVVLLIAFGMISLALYFANSMTMELRASDNRVNGMSSEQAIEGAARYITTILGAYATNGAVPAATEFPVEAVPVGLSTDPRQNAHYWLIGRDTNYPASKEVFFGLVDEASKLDLNAPWLTADILTSNMPVTGMTYDFAEAIMEWRTTNSQNTYSMDYSSYGYNPKQAPFETVDELRLVYGATKDLLIGNDPNRNGVLDANESDPNGGGVVNPGVMEYFTVYSRQPNIHSDGTSMTNVNNSSQIRALLQAQFGTSRGNTIYQRLQSASTSSTGGGGGGGGGGRGGAAGGGGAATTFNFPSLLRFYTSSGMTADEFGQIYGNITTTTNVSVGRVNINTAPVAVLACLPGMDYDLAQQVAEYRSGNPSALTSIAWIVDALGSNNQTALTALGASDCITTRSFQFTADVAALGAYGRGYRRVKFVFDISSGTPQIIFRQDLSRLGWALGPQVRNKWVTASIE